MTGEIAADRLAEQIVGFLDEVAPSGPIEGGLSATTPLVDAEVIDSVTLFELVAFIEDAVGVVVPFDLLVPDNFATVNAIVAMVTRLRAGEPASADRGS